jgi:hypothetical protein
MHACLEGEEELGMALVIVWKNPISLIRTNRTLHRVQGEQSEVAYAVTDPTGTQEFRLRSGEKMAGDSLGELKQELKTEEGLGWPCWI